MDRQAGLNPQAGSEAVSMAAIEASYDAVPYPSYSYAQTHPDYMATLAKLLGMAPAPVDQCRLLELGCAGGGNLLPMAYGLPASKFVGVDISARQIADGQEAVEALGLKNVRLERLDLTELGGDYGEFDYIVAHGLYSWVPPYVRDKLLEVCRRHLAPQGVAYVSYNTYPGWYVMRSIREMMLYHTRDAADPRTRATEAQALLSVLAQADVKTETTPGLLLRAHAAFLDKEMERSKGRNSAAMLHDELELVNDPVFLHEFVEHATRHELQYLAEAEFTTSWTGNLDKEAISAITQFARNHIELEQYLDFVLNRMFRRTLLCHPDVAIVRTLTPESVQDLYLASPAKPVSAQPDLETVSVEQFRASDKATLSIDHPVSKAAMLHLTDRWPQAVRFSALLQAARARVPAALHETGHNGASVDAQVLGANLLQAATYSENLARLHVHAPAVAREISDKPVATPVGRYMAARTNLVTNLYHQRVTLDGLAHFLLPYLDGSHDRDQLMDLLLSGPVADGVLRLKEQDESSTEQGELQDVLEGEVHRCLEWLAHSALLVA